MATEKSEKQKMLTGEYYHAGHPELSEDRKRCREILHQSNTTPQSPERHQIGRKLFGSYGTGNFINVNLRCDYGYNLFFGNNIEINYDCVFLDVGKITVGNDVFMAQVFIYMLSTILLTLP